MTEIYWDNWKYLFPTEKDVEQFLSGGTSLWGTGQGYDNQGRQRYYQYVSKLPKNSSILEIGFGQSMDYVYLKKEGMLDNKYYTGLDVTESFVKHANNKLGWKEAYKFDGLTIPYNDKYFDYTYTRHVWEHQPHYSTLLKEVFRVTKKEIFINWFIPPENIEDDEIHFEDKVFFHNKYSKAKLLKFIGDNNWSLKEQQLFKTDNSTDHIWVLQHD